ncbi:uncharacterized protein A1O9_03742 [Exophiala aquamarina CBS 119918]|uniref:Uncharacterized protein n=1 Tax=Exophiala aquamarina CBS 119918 TaxID=1182545 RepID=A0A072PFK6_9EURO|nr:uncharacterized protein A1O9_03742 [Exophiala aquamarina CBS 119918]KEF58899.1 hypothetical protein A1O9_03742 [Exophiala aquamarina CBS 119918]
MAARNADSMTNAQGEFHPRKPRDEPVQTSGHQIGQKVSPADHAPEFSAKTLPAGTAPKSATYQPNPVDETPGQANNPDVLRSHGKEGVQTDALSTLPGATSADVHKGLGHPGQGQTSNELRHEGAHTSTKQTSGLEGAGAQGGSGLREDGMNTEFRRLQQDGDHPSGPPAARAHNVSLDGAESKLPVASEHLAAEGTKTRALNDTNRSTNATGVPDRGAGSDRS